MAVALDFTYLQSNDCKTIVLTDNTGAYDASTNTGGWGTPNEETNDIILLTSETPSKYHLTLDVVYTDSNSVETTYDAIDLYGDFTSEFSKDYGMIYTLDMSHLDGTNEDVFPDGIYDITYSLTEADSDDVISTVTYNLLFDGNIRTKVYNKIIQTDDIYKQKQFNADERSWQDLLEGLFIYAEFTGLVTGKSDGTIDDSTKDKKIEMLYFLEQKLVNY